MTTYDKTGGKRVSRETIVIALFACFALGLPLVAMQQNSFDRVNIQACTGDCYDDWKASTGGIVAVVQAQAEARAAASPAELGEQAYVGCVACHGAGGEGGIGPMLAGQSAGDIATALLQYRNGETRGDQSSLMWSQAAPLSDDDIDNLAVYIEAL
jgi:cytochrome c553